MLVMKAMEQVDRPGEVRAEPRRAESRRRGAPPPTRGGAPRLPAQVRPVSIPGQSATVTDWRASVDWVAIEGCSCRGLFDPAGISGRRRDWPDRSRPAGSVCSDPEVPREGARAHGARRSMARQRRHPRRNRAARSRSLDRPPGPPRAAALQRFQDAHTSLAAPRVALVRGRLPPGSLGRRARRSPPPAVRAAGPLGTCVRQIAWIGMLGFFASAGSWARETPPARLTAIRPVHADGSTAGEEESCHAGQRPGRLITEQRIERRPGCDAAGASSLKRLPSIAGDSPEAPRRDVAQFDDIKVGAASVTGSAE